MSIGNVSSIAGSSGIISNQQPGNSNSGSAFQNAVTINANTPINLGTIDGKPFEMQILGSGGFEWSGQMQIQESAPGSAVTPEQAAAAYAAHSYSLPEQMQANHVGAVIDQLYLMENNGVSTDSLNNMINSGQISQNDVENALTRLGLNPSESFTVNGRTFTFNSENNLEEVTGSPGSA
jgi:hypothetical protein